MVTYIGVDGQTPGEASYTRSSMIPLPEKGDAAFCEAPADQLPPPRAHLATVDNAIAMIAMMVSVSGRSCGQVEAAAWAIALEEAAQARLRAILPVVAASGGASGATPGDASDAASGASPSICDKADGLTAENISTSVA